MNKQRESLKIISDGFHTDIYLDGKIVKGIREFELKQSLDEVMLLKLELVILPNYKGEEND